LRGLALVAAAPAKRGLEELLFEFFEGFVETNLLFEHFSNEGFQPFFHNDATSKRIGKFGYRLYCKTVAASLSVDFRSDAVREVLKLQFLEAQLVGITGVLPD